MFLLATVPAFLEPLKWIAAVCLVGGLLLIGMRLLGVSELTPPQPNEENLEELKARREAEQQAYCDKLQDFSRYPLPFQVTRGVADRLAGSSVKVSLQK